jgi:hypothetical protein
MMKTKPSTIRHFFLISCAAPLARSSKVDVRVAACRPADSVAAANASLAYAAPLACNLTPRVAAEVVLPHRFSHLEAATALQEHTARVLHFPSLRAGTFRGITDAAAYGRFERRLKDWTSLWCCKKAHPGHIHYDLFWDVKGHVDKHHKLWSGPWVPQTGP